MAKLFECMKRAVPEIPAGRLFVSHSASIDSASERAPPLTRRHLQSRRANAFPVASSLPPRPIAPTRPAACSPRTGTPGPAGRAPTCRRLASTSTVLAAHSWGGTVISDAGPSPNVTGMVYVAARAPDAGEDYAALAARFPQPLAKSGIVKFADFEQLSQESSCAISPATCPEVARSAFTPCSAPYRVRCSRRRRASRREGTNRPGTRCRRMTESRRLILKGSSLRAWGRRP